jgi:hypothetical protein
MFIKFNSVSNESIRSLDLILNANEIKAVAKLEAVPNQWRIFTASFGEFFVENVSDEIIKKVFEYNEINSTNTEDLSPNKIDKLLEKYV